MANNPETVNTISDDTVSLASKSYNKVRKIRDDYNEKLNQDQSGLFRANYKFPQNMDRNQPGRIKFTAIKLDESAIGKLVNKAGGLIGKSRAFIKGAVNGADNILDPTGAINAGIAAANNEEERQSVAEERKRKQFETENAGKSLARDAGQLFTDLAGVSSEVTEKEAPVGSVTLPLLRGLRFSDKANYETANLGVLGAGLEALLSDDPLQASGEFDNAAAGVIAQTLAKAVGVGATGLIGGALGGFGGAAIGAVAGGDLGDALGNTVKSATRVTMAPNKRTLFNDVDVRRFSFQFKMIAMNEKEAQTIKEIVKFFRYELYPETITASEGGLPFGYKFPNVWQIDIYDKEDKNPAFDIQRCFLESVDTTFNQTATGMFDGKYFVEVDVSLNFTEITALDKKKVEVGF